MNPMRAENLIDQLLASMKEQGGSDLFITAGFAPAIKLNGVVTAVGDQILSPDDSAMLVHSVMN